MSKLLTLGGASETLRYIDLAENIALTPILSNVPGGESVSLPICLTVSFLYLVTFFVRVCLGKE
jgi:hypothetical protein